MGALRRIREITFAASLALLGSCAATDGTSPGFTVQMARAAWLSAGTSSYTFEVSTYGDWWDQTPYYRVTVENGVTTSVRDEWGAELPSAQASTIEQLWQRILRASAEGTLQRADFTPNGVPVEWYIDNEAWADDASGGFIRNFRKR